MFSFLELQLASWQYPLFGNQNFENEPTKVFQNSQQILILEDIWKIHKFWPFYAPKPDICILILYFLETFITQSIWKIQIFVCAHHTTVCSLLSDNLDFVHTKTLLKPFRLCLIAFWPWNWAVLGIQKQSLKNIQERMK